MSVPGHIKWTTHRPVILAAPDWPEMAALKEHATSLGADVETSTLPASKTLRIVWVPKGFTGSAARAAARQLKEETASSMAELTNILGGLSNVAAGVAVAFTQLVDLLQTDPDR